MSVTTLPKPQPASSAASATENREGVTPQLSSLTAKTLMAITGAGLVLFVIAHMLGNLQIYLGQEALISKTKH